MPISNFTFEEMAQESGRGRISLADSEIVRVFKIAWTDLTGFMAALQGGWTKVNATTQTFTAPDRHPDWPNTWVAFADYEGMGQSSRDANGKSSWAFAKVTAVYRPLAFDLSGANAPDISEEDFDFSLEHKSHEPGSFETDDGDTVGDAVQQILPTMTYTITLLNMPSLPGGSAVLMYGMLGKINSAAFKGAQAGQLLFMGGQASRSTNLYGAQNWKIGLKFLFRRIDWQKAWVSSAGDYVVVLSKNGGSNLYETGDFNQLLPR